MDNVVLQQLMGRRSVRKFDGRAVEAAIMDKIIAAGQQAASSINGQQISLIHITDQKVKEQIAATAGGTANLAEAPTMLIVVADFYRVNEAIALEGTQQVVANSIEGFLTGAVDAGITVNTLATAAESFGLGTTVIGGIRNNIAAIIDICELPPLTIPIVGLIIGYPDENVYPSVKPRLAVDAYAFENTYKIASDYAQIFADYEEEMEKFRTISGHDSPKYSATVARLYGAKEAKLRDTRAIYEKQGFKLQ